MAGAAVHETGSPGAMTPYRARARLRRIGLDETSVAALLALLLTSSASYDAVNDYTATFLKQEESKGALGEQPHILGKHGKETAHEKAGHRLRIMLGFERTGQARQPVGNRARHPCTAPRRVKAQWVIPDLT